MIIQYYPDELDYVNVRLLFHYGALHPEDSLPPVLRSLHPDSFLGTFCLACLRADSDNYELLRPALYVLMKQYPADPERLRIERADRESTTRKDGAADDRGVG